MSWLTCCCCIAVIACGIGLFHMARASSRLTSVQINTTKTILVVRSCSVFTAPLGAHTCLECECVFTHPVGYKWSLSTANETCNKDKGYCTKIYCRCTSYKSSRTSRFGVHLFASLEKTTCRHWSILRSLMSKRPLQVSRSWLLLIQRAQKYFLTFSFGVHRAVRCTWTKWQWKLVHSPYQHPPAPSLH